jgi:hypothetical protein
MARPVAGDSGVQLPAHQPTDSEHDHMTVFLFVSSGERSSVMARWFTFSQMPLVKMFRDKSKSQ